MNPNRVTPESGGISSLAIKRYLELLEDAGLSTHSLIIARGNDILFEKYYPPFHPDFLHREYSQTKSLVSLAVGFAEQDGLVGLDDPISKYFPDESEQLKDPKMGEQTVRNMLMMSTPKSPFDWLNAKSRNLVVDYFTKVVTTAPLGSAFNYDSTGSTILGIMVERLTGMPFMEYLRIKLFDKLGISEQAHCLKIPDGYSWGSSAAMMKPRDMMKLIRFILDKGKIDCEQVLNEKYLTDATSDLISNGEDKAKFNSQGYGYQIWRTYDGGFSFNGMGCQFSIGVPSKDLILIINSDDQGIPNAGQIIFDGFFELIARPIGEPIPDDPTAKAELDSYAESLILAFERGEKHSPIESEIDGRLYLLDENPLGITSLGFTFADDRGILEYTNAQGAKTLVFGLCENCFTLFPEEGYSREVGLLYAPGNYYKCAASAAWKSERELSVFVQVIDEYFGRLRMTFVFDGDNIALKSVKAAQDFFTTYQGEARGIRAERA